MYVRLSGVSDLMTADGQYHLAHSVIFETAKKQKFIPIHQVATEALITLTKNILNLHAFTGCDTNSSFSRLERRPAEKDS